jgi:hypothetical protein
MCGCIRVSFQTCLSNGAPAEQLLWNCERVIKASLVAGEIPVGTQHLVQLSFNGIEKLGERWVSFRVGIPHDVRVDHDETW